ncbi:MAG: hypothetical protein KAS78_01820 [Candidatus Pacebacteria bacterium]|nr:hypothetical protein [Candidatus Paceibacterota bacterium]
MNNKIIVNLFYKNRDASLVFFAVFLLFSIIQFSSGNLAGNDSHLYIKLAEMTKNQGLIKEFPWLNSTVMNSSFTGLHFLYYFFLIPFTFFGNLIFGAKLASLFFFSSMVSMFYFVLKTLGLKHNLFWCFLLLSSSGYFLFRMNLARPLSFSVIFLLLIFYALVQRNNFLLFITSFLFVWAHASFPLSVVFVFVFVFVNYMHKKKIYYKTILASLTGMILAFFVNPFFPNNLNYFNIYYIGSMPYYLTSSISEWQPLGINLVFFDTTVVFVLFLALVVIYFVMFVSKISRNTKNKKNETEHMIIIDFLLIISVVLFIAMFLQGRYIDYWIPFAVLFIAFHAEFLSKNYSLLVGSPAFSWMLSAKYKLKSECAIFLIVFLGISFFSKAGFVFSRMGKDGSAKGIHEISQWLEKNTPKESVVFNVNWGDFSKLFFYNTHNYYITGLDPKFLYKLSPEKYWLYSHISEGIVCDEEKCREEDERSVYDIIKKEFSASYIYVPKNSETDYNKLISILESDQKFDIEYWNDAGEIWAVK